MVQTILIAIAAGIAAALLFLAPSSGSMLAFPLFILTGLPLAIATFGWGVRAGAIATAAGTVVTYLVYPGSIVSAAMFLCLFGVPVLWLSRLAGRPYPLGSGSAGLEWYPLNRLLLQLVGTVVVVLIAAGFVSHYDPESLVHEAAAALVDVLGTVATNPAPTPESVEPLVRIYVGLMPFVVAGVMTAILTFDLWLGSLVARGSGRASRRPDPLWSTELPVALLPAFVIAAVFAFFPGLIGELGKLVAGAAFGGFVLVGLAILHALTRGSISRMPILVLAYILLIFSGLLAVFVALVGATDPFVRLRSRRQTLQPPSR
jgi:hypothetical protein